MMKMVRKGIRALWKCDVGRQMLGIGRRKRLNLAGRSCSKESQIIGTSSTRPRVESPREEHGYETGEGDTP